MLKIKNLKKYFGGIKAIDNCDINIDKNKITALIGPNGAGKSTIFDTVSGVIKADSGKIIFNNKNITNLEPHIISNLGISRMFQQSKLFNNLKVKDNLILALDNDEKFLKNLITEDKINKEEKEKIMLILKQINMEKFYDKVCSELSYGQKRLIELARTVLKPHKFLMLDEPVAGVNPKIRNEISKILLNLKKNNDTILFIEHDMNFTLNIADYVIVMDEGKVIAQGKPSMVKNNKKVIEAYLGE